MLRVRNLTKTFGGIIANGDISLDVAEHEFHAVIGPNGAGKTTLVAQLTGALKPDAGRVEFRGRDITRLPAHARAHRGIARSFQITSIMHGMSTLDNVLLAVQAHAGHSYRFWRPAQRDARLVEPAMEALARVGLKARAADVAGDLSHGEHRQLEIAMALAAEPALLLLDEPTAGMGAEESAQMVAFLQSLRGEKTILLVEHDMDAVFALADTITVLVEGRVVASGKPDAIREDATVRSAYLGDEVLGRA